MTRPRIGKPRSHDLITGKSRKFIFSKMSKADLGPTQPPLQWASRVRLVQRLRISGVPLISPQMPSWRTQGKLLLFSLINNINTRFNSDLHTPTANLTFQKGPFYFGIKVFNYLPTNIKNTSHDIKQFRSTLKSFFLINSFYAVEEYFTWNSNRDLGPV